MRKKTLKFREYHLEKLKNRKEAQVYLEVALEEFEKDGDKEIFLKALRDVAEAQGGLTHLSERAHLNRQNLYKALSKKGNPKLETVGLILHGLGFRFSIEPVASWAQT
ncbi:MAG: putative addiction module antidote protein [Deltaproteobacteria bacterium]|nr:putative addiction module antidote protein [Deltaproteobacteria bacterium]